jgi:hypothetical protein
MQFRIKILKIPKIMIGTFSQIPVYIRQIGNQKIHHLGKAKRGVAVTLASSKCRTIGPSGSVRNSDMVTLPGVLDRGESLVCLRLY